MKKKCLMCGSEDCGVCATCGEEQCQHHEFVALVRPSPHCCCEVREWSDPSNIPPVCDGFEGADGQANCQKCEHDKECHAPKK